jgi:hypothetical protein
MYDAFGRRSLTNTEVVGKFNVSTGTVYQGNKPVLQFNMTEGEEFHIQSFSWMDERGEVIASQTTTTSDAAKPTPQELAATWHLNQLDGTEFTNTKSWMATEFAFAGNKRGTVNSDPITELQTSTRSLHEGRYALFLESEDAAYRSWADPAHEVLNYVGILDPFGVADGINAVWYVGEGLMGREVAFLNAGISAAGALLPYVGDLLKFGKAGVKAAAGRAYVKKLPKADKGMAWLHEPDMRTGGLPSDVRRQGSKRINSIIGGNSRWIAQYILKLPDNINHFTFTLKLQ